MLLNPYRFVTGGGGGSDPHFANVSLLLHGEGSDGAQVFTDSSGLALSPISVTGSIYTRTAQKMFGGASISVEVGASFVRYQHAALAMGTGDFTWEAWVRPTSLSAERVLIEQRSTGGSGGGMLYVGASQLKYYDGSTILTGTTTLANNNWYHVAVTRQGSTTRIFVNGNLEASGSSTLNMSNDTITLGRSAAASTNFFGYLDEVRITKGVARYTASFTPPSAQFPDS